ncbi:MAG: Glycine/sarcosine/dimethylglycine N-methyltransferase [Candidatus Scalindua arabica]|uniref:Glycine/sarcosine/dimethylglycine N-methyltransferase n=1 Tax=Candidatus Scalindua arabica TaxID=1127984 RepID=A0A942A1P1_9BACT|nr:Glycine/sarcosine/dimethylglycine N-methyltransferase [Candidatus Scalindua arabica]
MIANSKQSFGKNPVKVRETGHYKKEYIEGFVEKWDELIDWEMRAKSEGDFLISRLKERGAQRILDVATGTGFHSVCLIEAGFDVVSADGSADMLAKAFENGRNKGHILRTAQADWRWLNRDIHGTFDAVICLGNSFTHLFSERDRRKALAEFYAALNHDGVLILDQRNYDSILDHGYSSKHTYYYCGDNITVEPEYIDDGLARFKYRFPDNSQYHLNMFPLRKDYVRKLLHEVGFQRVESYGDFQETYRMNEPDFFFHVAEKCYDVGNKKTVTGVIPYSEAERTAKSYYDSEDADNFYFTIWGGEDIHIGIYKSDEDSVAEASSNTVKVMASHLSCLHEDATVLDLGAGYGGAARFLARNYGCHVSALNLSTMENERNIKLNSEQGLEDKIDVVEGSFENILYPDDHFDVVWSNDAILHSNNRSNVLEEAVRVLKSGGVFIFTDPMQSDDCHDDVLQPILDRIHLSSLGSPKVYREMLSDLGMEEVAFYDHTEQLVNHYTRVLGEIEKKEKTLSEKTSEAYITQMKAGLKHWIDGGKDGSLVWGIFIFRKQ